MLPILALLLVFQAPQPTPASGEFDQLEFSISTDRTQYVLGEPIKLNFSLTNHGAQDLLNDFYLTFDFDRLSINVSVNGREFEPYQSKAMQIASRKKKGRNPILLRSGETIQSFELISLNVLTNDFAAPKPGDHSIKAGLIFDHYETFLESNVVQVSVMEPSGEDAAALAFIESAGLQWALTPERRLFPESLDAAMAQGIQELLNGFPNSVYRGYAQGN